MTGLDYGLFVSALTAVVAVYLGFRHQQRLRAFELFLGRRECVLDEVANEIAKLYEILDQLADDDCKGLEIYSRQILMRNIILVQRIKGCAFGKTADIIAQTISSVAHEPYSNKDGIKDAAEWVNRVLNVYSVFFALGHSELSYEMRLLSMSLPMRIYVQVKRWKKNKNAMRKDKRMFEDKPSANDEES